LPYEQPCKFVPNYLMTSLADLEYWERALRYHYCHMHDLLCGFSKNSPSQLWRVLKSHILFTMVAFTIWFYHQKDQNNFKESYSLDDRDGVFDGYTNSILSPRVMWLSTFILAIIGIISFSLAISPMDSLSYQAPLGIIGKVYANSMLVLINSLTVLGSEETQTPSTVISVLRFGTAPENPTDSAIEVENGNVAVDTRLGTGPSGSSEPEAI
jgi:hypothetical protein